MMDENGQSKVTQGHRSTHSSWITTAQALAIVVLVVAGSFIVRSDPRWRTARILDTAAGLILNRASELKDPKEAIDAGARGMIERLDPFTEYMPPVQLHEFAANTEGSYTGIGVEITQINDKVVIVRTMPLTPAAEAGLEPGQIIRAVDSKSTADWSLMDVVTHVRGEPGSKVALTLESPDGEIITVPIVRREVAIAPFSVADVTTDSIAIAKWDQFTQNSAAVLESLLVAWDQQGAEALILDLRGNPGGLLQEAIHGASLFLPAGDVVCHLRTKAGHETTFRTFAVPRRWDKPVVLVLDGGSASASEVLAGALRDHNRVVLAGRETFGKGWVQELYGLRQGAALRLSTGRYTTPSGRHIGRIGEAALIDSLGHHGGFPPDTTVPQIAYGGLERILAGSGIAGAYALQLERQFTGRPDSRSPKQQIAAFREFADSVGIQVPTEWDRIVDSARSVFASSALADDFLPLLDRLDSNDQRDLSVFWEGESSSLLRRISRMRVITRGAGEVSPTVLDDWVASDPYLQVAHSIIRNEALYDSLRTREPIVPDLPETSASLQEAASP